MKVGCGLAIDSLSNMNKKRLCGIALCLFGLLWWATRDEKNMIVTSTVIDRIFVVNLDSQRARWQRTYARLEKADPTLLHKVERWPATPTWSSHVSRVWAQRHDDMAKPFQNKGELALVVTYVYLLEEAKARGYRNILVLEDDVLFAHDFAIKLRMLPDTFKIVLLGASQWESTTMTPVFYHPYHTDGSFAILIDHSVFDLLLWKLERYDEVLDGGALRMVYTRYRQLCHVYNPNIVIADVTESNLRGPQNMKVRATKMKWHLENFNLGTPPQWLWPLVSVAVIAVGSTETRVCNTIASIHNQSYPNIEVLLVHNRSFVCERIKHVRCLQAHLQISDSVPGQNNLAIGAGKGVVYTSISVGTTAVYSWIETLVAPILENRVQMTAMYQKPHNGVARLSAIAFRRLAVVDQIDDYVATRFPVCQEEYVERYIYARTGIRLPKHEHLLDRIHDNSIARVVAPLTDNYLYPLLEQFSRARLAKQDQYVAMYRARLPGLVFRGDQ